MTFHSIANRLAAVFMKLLFGSVARVHLMGSEHVNRAGGLLLAANHISHFDPFIISAVVRRKIDWMAMAEFFAWPIIGSFLRAVDAFPAARDRADRATIRTTIERLKASQIVGVFPEGGIRAGTRSLLEGAPLRRGVSTLAQIAGVPVLPCVILGSDRLYNLKRWLPPRRTPVWIAFGNPVPCCAELEKTAARACIEREVTSAFQTLYADLREKFQLAPDDLPHSPQERMRRCSASGSRAAVRRGKRSGYLVIRPGAFRRLSASTVDFAMCASMNLLQSRHRLHVHSREEMERYVADCEKLTVHEYYYPQDDGDLPAALENGTTARILTWRSPVKTRFPANDTARVDLFPCQRGWNAPTVLMLHALLSATHFGYRRLARHFNARGWNACFVHLPYHYSRVPRGYWNGELAITADLMRNAEGLRQGVMELRQLLRALRKIGCSEFGILGMSYGGWIGALLAAVERDLRFVALMAPIVNVEHAMWQSPGTAWMRKELRRLSIEPALVARHFHLSSPSHTQPVCDPSRVLFVSGDFDAIARPEHLEQIHQRWRGSQLLRVRQGHFGYRMLPQTVAHLAQCDLLSAET
ncbi:MAG TPA: 1-acyl-sn-glycerol-3-phosphate acyltransferase [Chthoniobacterales bacterium]|nr:1-acyl-sn-glycerol-3-phosphate acyltransferase [Chthoniobacterales bacterium]